MAELPKVGQRQFGFFLKEGRFVCLELRVLSRGWKIFRSSSDVKATSIVGPLSGKLFLACFFRGRGGDNMADLLNVSRR